MDQGFVDTHIHGAFGFDTSDGIAGDMVSMAEKLATVGTCAFCPTTMMIDTDKILKSFEAVAEARERLEGSGKAFSKILGMRLEGPFLNPEMCGVQDSSNAILPRDSAALIDRLEREFPGLLKMIDISPELDGGVDMIKEYSEKYVFSLAHTAADYDIASAAFEAGAKSVTHVFNAMKPMLKRDTGVLGAAIDHDAYVEVIADGKHVHAPYLKLLYSDVLENRIITISDSMRGCLMPDGTYDLGGTPVEVYDGQTHFGPQGGLAGSVTYMAQEFETLKGLGIDEDRIKKTMRDNPLRRMGITELC